MPENKYVGLEALQTFLDNIKNAFVDRQSFDSTTETKKEKDLIVTYKDGSTFGVTHSSEQVLAAVNNGQTVKFKKGTELLDLLEVTADYATFYIIYVNMQGKLQQQIVVIGGSNIMLEQNDTYDYATIAQLNSKVNQTELTNNYYTKTQTEEYVDEHIAELEIEDITSEDINALFSANV
jgi:hypothetical protein